MDPRIKILFLDALDQPPESRDAWLKAHCKDEAELDAVKALLGAHDSAPSFAAPTLAAELSRPTTARAIEREGDLIADRYLLERRLGEGGFGEVFLARQTDPVVRDVAIKLLKPGIASEQVIQRFEAEQQALALMDHPQIARVFDAGTTETHRPYFVMEYVAGESITDYAERKQLGLQDRLELIEQLCLAIQHAHQKGVIHRDLKPGNILVADVDGRPQLKVIDFGIAKAVDEGSVLPSITIEPQIIGTPQYMSPEQATLGPKNIDTRSDVYSIGTVLYELIAGVPPFDPAEMRAAGLEKICQIVRERTPAKPSTRLTTIAATGTVSATRLSREMSGEIDWIVMKALEKEPARRYQSAADLAADIRRYIEHQPVLAGPPSAIYQARKFVRRHRLAVSAAAVVALSLVGATVVSLVMAQRARRAEHVAVAESDRAHQAEQTAIAEADNARRELRRANAVVDFTKDLLEGIGPSVARGRDTTLVKDLMGRAIEKSNTRFDDQPRLKLLVQNLISTSLYDLGDYPKATDVIRAQYESMNADTGGVEWLATGVTYARLLAADDKYDDAQRIIDLSIAGTPTAQLEPFALLKAKVSKAVFYTETGHFAEAEALANEAIEGFKQIGQLDTREGLQARNAVTMAEYGVGHLPKVAENWKAIADDMLRILGPEDPSTLNITGNLASVLMDLNRIDEADFYYRRVMELAPKVFEPGNPVLITHMLNYTDFLFSQNRAPEAEPFLIEADKTIDRAHKQLAWNLRLQQMKFVERTGRWDDMIRMALEGFEDYDKRFGHPDRRTFGTYADLIRAYTGAGRYEDALKFVETVGPKVAPDDADPRSVHVFNASMGLLYLKMGRVEDAKAAYDVAANSIGVGLGNQPYRNRFFVQLEKELLAAGASTQPTTAPATQPVMKPEGLDVN